MHSSANCWNQQNNHHLPDCQLSGQPPPALSAVLSEAAPPAPGVQKHSEFLQNTAAGLFKQHDIQELVIISTPPASCGLDYWMSFRGLSSSECQALPAQTSHLHGCHASRAAEPGCPSVLLEGDLGFILSTCVGSSPPTK